MTISANNSFSLYHFQNKKEELQRKYTENCRRGLEERLKGIRDKAEEKTTEMHSLLNRVTDTLLDMEPVLKSGVDNLEIKVQTWYFKKDYVKISAGIICGVLKQLHYMLIHVPSQDSRNFVGWWQTIKTHNQCDK